METKTLLFKCVSIDLEVDPNTSQIQSFAAIRKGTADTCNYSGDNLPSALSALDVYTADAEFVLGHNVIAHDLPHLQAARSDLRILTKPSIDTLWLNPLAFPRNPYHRLVKHYKDGALQGGNASDPELDAGLVLTLLQNQLAAFREFRRSNPNLMTALHWRATTGGNMEGFNAVFGLARGAPRPAAPDAQRAIRQILADRACTH